MTHLRKVTLEELQRRNLSKLTAECYLRVVEEFALFYHRPPDQLGPEQIRQYQAHLFTDKKLDANTVAQHLSALGFFFIKTLKRNWGVEETPKRPIRLPDVLSRDEVQRLIESADSPLHRVWLVMLYATGLRREELVQLKVTDIDSARMLIHVHQGKGNEDRDIMLSPRLSEISAATLIPNSGSIDRLHNSQMAMADTHPSPLTYMDFPCYRCRELFSRARFKKQEHKDPERGPLGMTSERLLTAATGPQLLVALIVWTGAAVAASPEFFAMSLYPVLDKAGCKSCHHADGVASATRLHFPAEGASTQIIDAFGDSLLELVDRAHPEKSLLLNKPTNRIKHTGGERIKKGSGEEALLIEWVNHLASLSDSESRRALSFRRAESAKAGEAPKVMLRRLTHRQYGNTVRDLLGESSDPSSQFPPEDFVDGFKNQYRSQTLSPLQIEAYSLAAERLARRAFLRGDSRHLIPCSYVAADAAGCRSEFVRTFGLKAFRRPMDPKETEMYRKIFQSESDFLKGAEAVIESMLQAPSFLFWMEGTSRAEWKPYVTASRLSYSLWDTTPDDELLRSATRGELDSSAGVERAARRMLADPRASPALDEFTSQWLRFDRALAAAREKRSFPLFSPELVSSMIEESRRFVGDLVWNDRDFMDVFRGSYGFVNSDLAAVYKVPAPAQDFDRTEFPASQERSGVLGQALFLTLTSKPEDTAPTGRGLFVREQFLCQQVPPPPPGVDTNLPPVTENRPVTNRERLAGHTISKACSTCHNLIDPIGFGLEKFDAIGVRREKVKLLFFPDVHEAKIPNKEVELDLDTTGQVAGIENSQFSSPRQLGEILAGSRQCQECVVKQVFRYLAGRHETAADEPRISRALADFQKSGFHFKELLISLITLVDDYGQHDYASR